ncbi:MAG: type IV secretory system conjugative DNA transfer family protein [Clostridiales bacterium]|nr:type IV secretory system conjugative DNA transfer family protein [Candidatus Cacconaster stercorequi]
MGGALEKLGKGRYTLYILLGIVASGVVGFLLRNVVSSIGDVVMGNGVSVDFGVLLDWQTWLIGLVFVGIFALVSAISNGFHFSGMGGALSSKKKADVNSVLENSRFMTEKERDKYYKPRVYEDLDGLKSHKEDGVPARAIVDKKGQLQINFINGVHSLVVGSTGSGKTTTFINPMIQLLAATSCGSSMIMTDPKGELFDLHSQYLKDRGYDVLVMDLRDTYSSCRWNPLDAIWDMYQEFLDAGKGIIAHRDNMADYPDLNQVDGLAEPDAVWCEWRGKAYADLQHCYDDAASAKQRIYDEMYEDLSDLISGICPITNEKDPLWEKGARSIVMATCLAMLEDSEDSRLEMTKEKFNFFNLNKILTNSENEYQALKDYFAGRSALSQAVTLSRQVLAAADQTLSSYMSITFDKLSIFNDRGICGLTSATDIHAEQFAERPTALFLKIPDEKDTRHGLASLFVLSIYKALIKVASARDDLSLPRNVYFIMDEFGNMPKIEKFDKMITVGRSRKIWFNMVVQSYAQLKNVYGEGVAEVVKSNCGMKMFIGSNDIDTCKEFSELCGNKTVRTVSTSSSVGSREGDVNVSNQLQTRPLIYPSELQKLNNKESTGNAVIVTFGNYPLMTKYTPSYKCKYYHFGRMNLDDIRSHVFLADKVFYDINARNRLILGE